MTHYMRLRPLPFFAIKEGRKKVEMRLYDEKRRAIAKNDIIVFENTESEERLYALVTGLSVFKDFKELFAHYPKDLLGYGAQEPALDEDMLAYYTREEIEVFGVLAIEIKLGVELSPPNPKGDTMDYPSKLSDIHLRDPFILVDGGLYYMYGSKGSAAFGPATGLDVFVSEDLENWSLPHEVLHRPDGFWADRDFWAPEVHLYNGKYYMLVSMKAEGVCRGTVIFKADNPKGPFLPYSDGPVTPRDWECLDGTLYIEDGVPYMVFCHEWVQTKDGEMCAVRLSADLKKAEGEPLLLFKASSFPAVASVKDEGNFVTDGPFLLRLESGKLLMLWSSYIDRSYPCYCEIVSYSESGKIKGPWRHEEKPLFDGNGGHGMVFKTKEQDPFFVMHQPNNMPNERPVLFALTETEENLSKKE